MNVRSTACSFRALLLIQFRMHLLKSHFIDFFFKLLFALFGAFVHMHITIFATSKCLISSLHSQKSMQNKETFLYKDFCHLTSSMKVVFNVLPLNSFRIFYAVFSGRASPVHLQISFSESGVLWIKGDLTEQVEASDIHSVG